MKRWTPVAGAMSVSIVLAGCAAIPADRGAATTALLKPRSDVAAGLSIAGSSGDIQSETAKILAAPMNADAAVRVALLQSPRMRALYARLGFAHADIYDASRLSNPSLGYLRLTADGGASKTTWSLAQSFTELLFLGHRTRVGRSQLLQTQQTVASEVLALEADVRGAYYEYVSATLVAQMRERVVALTGAVRTAVVRCRQYQFFAAEPRAGHGQRGQNHAACYRCCRQNRAEQLDEPAGPGAPGQRHSAVRRDAASPSRDERRCEEPAGLGSDPTSGPVGTT